MREAIERCLEEDLGLAVNREKNEVAKVKDVPFAGFQILRGKIRVSDKATAKFKDRARKLTRRNNALSMYQVIHYLNEYLGGWVAYFRVQEFNSAKTGQRPGCLDTKPAEVNVAEQMEGPKKFQEMLIRNGYKPQEVRRVWVKMNKWQSHRREVHFVMPARSGNLQWFRARGLIFPDDFTQRTFESR